MPEKGQLKGRQQKRIKLNQMDLLLTKSKTKTIKSFYKKKSI